MRPLNVIISDLEYTLKGVKNVHLDFSFCCHDDDVSPHLVGFCHADHRRGDSALNMHCLQAMVSEYFRGEACLMPAMTVSCTF